MKRLLKIITTDMVELQTMEEEYELDFASIPDSVLWKLQRFTSTYILDTGINRKVCRRESSESESESEDE